MQTYPEGSKLNDPSFRHERARKAALARSSVDAHVAAIVAAAPRLTAAQHATLATLLAAA